MKKYLLIALALPMLLASCITRERCAERYPPEVSVKDSIVRSDSTIVLVDTVIVPGETVTVRLNIPCPEANMEKVFKKNGTTAKLLIKNGVVTCEAKTDSLTRIIEQKTRTIKELRSHSRKEVAPPIVKTKTPWWVWPTIWGLSGILLYTNWRKLLGLVLGFFKRAT